MPQLMSPIDCRVFRRQHLAYLDDTLSGDQMAAAQRHILSCDACAAHDTMVRRSLMLAKSLPNLEPSSAFQARLNARLAECRTERERGTAARVTSKYEAFDDALLTPIGPYRALWRSPRTLATIAAGAVIGALVWRGLSTSQAPLVAMQPVIASQPVRADVRYVSPALLQAMASGNPVWPATVIIDEAPSALVNASYSIAIDGR